MGNQSSNRSNKENANVEGHKVFLSLRCRDIILHYSYKMKLSITDISLFPHGLQGLRLWDQDIILSRYIILQNEKFRNKSAFVFKGGVGIVGICLSKWGGCKKIDMCDTRPQVVGNMTKNCQRNQVKNVKCFEVNLAQFGKYSQTYDLALSTDLFSEGFQPHVILNIWRKVLKIGGESIMLMPDKKDQCKKLLEIVDRSEFKIQNMLLTADQYEASPLLNKLEGESQFPQIGKTNFYLISLTKLREKTIAEIKAEQQQALQNKKSKGQQKIPETKPSKKQQKVIKPKQIIVKEEVRHEQSIPIDKKEQQQIQPQQQIKAPSTEKQSAPKKEVIEEPQKQQVKQQIKQEIQQEIKQEVKQQNKQEVKQEIKQQTKQEVRQQTKQEVRQQTKLEVKQQSKQEIKEEIKNPPAPQTSEKNQIVEEKKTQQIPQENATETVQTSNLPLQKPIQNDQNKQPAEEEKTEELPQQKVENKPVNLLQQIQPQDNSSKPVAEEHITQNISSNKQEAPQLTKEIPQTKPLEEVQTVNLLQQNQPQKIQNKQEVTEEKKEEEISQKAQETPQEKTVEQVQTVNLLQQNYPEQQIKEQPQQEQKAEESPQIAEVPAAQKATKQEKEVKQEKHKQFIKQHIPDLNTLYNITNEELVYDGYVPSQDEKNGQQVEKHKGNNSQEKHEPAQHHKEQKKQEKVEQEKQHQENKSANVEEL